MSKNTYRICGLAAVKARFERDPDSVVRLYFDAPTSKKAGELARMMANARKAYRIVEREELEKVGQTVHHGGIVAVAGARRLEEPRGIEDWAEAKAPVLILDRITNSHNLGAIARSAAFFGVKHLVLAADGAQPGDAAYRVAEGGLDRLDLWKSAELPALLKRLAERGYDVVGAATRGGEPVSASKRPWALVLGNEEHGLSRAVESACARLVTIEGQGLESLNVSVAAAVLMYALGARR